MIRHTVFLCIAVATITSTLFSQQQDDFPVGVFLFGGINVDFAQMDTSLNLTWVQGYTGWNNFHYPIDTNSAGLKVISMREGILQVTRSQHMVYEAERNAPQGWQDDGLWNYFGYRHPDYSIENNSLKLSVGSQPGYMVHHPRPNNDFHYEQSQYYATFSVAITKGANLTDTVATLSIYTYYNGGVQNVFVKTLRDSNFQSSFPQYYNFKVPFNLTVCDPPCAAVDSALYLSGGLRPQLTNLLCDSIDIRVDWRGYRTTWLDKVTSDDVIADALFAHQYDALIEQEVYDYLYDPRFNLMQRLYTTDEPYVPAFLPYNYVDSKLRDLGFTASRGRAITANYWTDNWMKRFIQDAQPHEIFVDPYVIPPSAPSPSMTEQQANDVGVTPYSSNSQYNTAIQSTWDYLERYIAPQALHAKDAGIPMWHIPQLHGIYRESSGHYWGLRAPTGTEIQAQINIGLAFGSKGVVSYPFGTDNYLTAFDSVGSWGPGLVSRNVINGKYTDHSKDTAWLPYPGQPNGRAAYTGYKEKWDSLASINAKLLALGPTLKGLAWQGVKSWWSTITYGNWSGIVTSVGTAPIGSFPETHPFPVLTGHMKDSAGTIDYLYVVNRRTDNGRYYPANTDIRRIVFTISKTGDWLLTEVLTNRSWVCKNATAIADTFMPGEGKLYRLSPADVAGSLVFPQLRFQNGGTLTLASNANITARGNMDTVNIVLGSNATFKADTGSTMVIARDSAFVFGSGSLLEIAGLLRTTYGNYTTVPYGSTLRIRPGAVLEWGTYGSLVIEGTLSAIGTASNPITITRAPGELAPSGIHLAYGSVDTLEHCRITELYTGVSIAYCTARIRNNEFLNCTIAISSDAYKRSPLIEGNTIDSCYIGLDVVTSSPIGTPVISSNDIQHCDYGVVLNPSFGSTISINSIHLNQTGILVDGSTPVLRGNIIENNAVDGVYATNYSNPRFGDYAFNDPGNNVIRYNGETQIHSYRSSPFLGEIFYEPQSDCEHLDPSSTFGGFNSVYDPDGKSYLVFTGKGSTVTAIGTWWGQCPPDDNRFFTDGWPFYYLPALDYDPNEGMRPSILASGTKEILESGQMDPRLRNSLLRQALVLRSRRNYSGALVLYTSVIADNLSEMDVNTALQEVRHTYHDYIRWSSDTTLQATLESYLRNQSANHPRAAIKRLARILRASELANMGNYTGSVTEYQQLLRSSSVPDERVMYLFQLFNLNAVRLVNREQAQQYLTQMQNEFPADGRTRIAAIRFGAMTSRTSGNGLQKPSLAANAEQTPELPREFTLSQNYPNPFNPTTTIKYGLPIDAHVTLKLYDVLGREVLTLVNEQTRAGYHYTALDASRFSSGVYFYRIRAGQFSQTKKLILVR